MFKEVSPVFIFNPNLVTPVKSQKKPLNFSYKCLFMMFRISGIFPMFRSYSGDCRTAMVKYSMTAISVTILLVHVYLSLLAVLNHWLYQNPVANTSLNLLTFVHRCVLSGRWHRLVKIASLTSSFEMDGDCKFKFWIYAWTFLNSIIGISLTFCDTKIMSSIGIPSVHYGVQREDYLLYNLAAALHAIYFNVIAQLPVVIFGIFYIIVCNQIRCAVQNFSTKLTEECDHDVLLESYAAIKSTVAFADSELSFLMFCGTIFTSTMMYYTVSVLLHPKTMQSPLHTAVTICHFTNTLVSFIAMTAAASSVSEASAEVGERAQAQSVDRVGYYSPFAQQRFTSYAEKEIHLTVWKIVPIRRYFTVATLGAIFTYAVLFDNLLKR